MSNENVITKEELEVAEIATDLTEYLIENYGEYPSHVLFASLMVVTNSLFKAMEQQRKNKNESAN